MSFALARSAQLSLAATLLVHLACGAPRSQPSAASPNPSDAGVTSGDSASSDAGTDGSVGDATYGDASQRDAAPTDAGVIESRLEIELREHRIDGPGPGIAGRRIVQFESAYLNPVVLAETDNFGTASIEGPSPFDVAVEAPDGERFFLVSGLTAGAYVLTHPNYPGPDDVMPVTVQLHPSGTTYDRAGVIAGAEQSPQEVLTSSAASRVRFALERRNLHADNTVSVVGVMLAGDIVEMRAGLSRPIQNGIVVLDRALTRVTLEVDVANPALEVIDRRLYGEARGAWLPLSSGSGDAFLPMGAQGLDASVFERYVVLVTGGASAGGSGAGWTARVTMTPLEAAQALSAGVLRVVLPLDGPDTIIGPQPANAIIVHSAIQASPTESPRIIVTTYPDGLEVAAPRLAGENVLIVEGIDFATEQVIFSTRLNSAQPGALTIHPAARIFDFRGVANARTKTASVTWTIAPPGLNRMRIHFEVQAVSTWILPYYSDVVTGAAYPFLSTAGRAGGGDSVTVDFIGASGAPLASTESTVAPGATWILHGDGLAPQAGDVEPVEVVALEAPLGAGADWVRAQALYEATGARLMRAGTQTAPGWGLGRSAARFSVTWSGQ